MLCNTAGSAQRPTTSVPLRTCHLLRFLSLQRFNSRPEPLNPRAFPRTGYVAPLGFCPLSTLCSPRQPKTHTSNCLHCFHSASAFPVCFTRVPLLGFALQGFDPYSLPLALSSPASFMTFKPFYLSNRNPNDKKARVFKASYSQQSAPNVLGYSPPSSALPS